MLYVYIILYIHNYTHLGVINMDYGLTRLILIDSYLPGRIYEIKLDGHTNILGGNAAGKTSLIKLAVLFYGESPITLGIKEDAQANHQGFVMRYLPRNGSYLIFEYLSRGKLRSLVYSPHPSDRDKYFRHFLPTGYHLEDYWNEATSSPKDSFQWIREKKLKYPGQIKNVSTDREQTNILLGGKDIDYGLGPLRLDMTRMKKLMTSMFSKNAGHTELTQIIKDWVNTDLQQSIRLPDGIVEKAFIRSWLDEYRALKWLSEQQTDIADLEAYFAEYNSALSLQKDYYLCAKDKHEAITEDKALALGRYREEKRELSEIIRKQGVEVDRLESEKAKKQAHLDELTGERDTLDRTKKGSLSRVPDDFDSQVAQQPPMLLKKATLEAEKDELLKSERSLEEKKNRAITALDNEISTGKLEFEKTLSDAKSSMLEEREALTNAHLNKKSLALKPITKQIKANEGTLSELNIEIAKQEMFIQHFRLDDTEYAQKALIEEAIVELSEQRDEVFYCLERLQGQYVGLEGQKSDQDKHYFRLLKELDELEDELGEKAPFESPPENSLVAFLQDNTPNWPDTFGKALRPEVLLQPKLEPVLKEASSTAIFGVEIATENLMQNFDLITDKDELVEVIKNLRSSIHTKNTELKKALQASEKTSNNLDALRSEISEQKQVHKNIKDAIGLKNRALGDEIRRLKSLVVSEKNKLGEQVKRLKEEAQSINEHQITLNKSVDKLKAEFDEELQTLLEGIETNYSGTVKRIKKDNKQLTEDITLRKQDVIERYQRELEDKGIDPKYIEKLDDEIRKIKAFEQRLTRYKNAKLAYDGFMNNDYIPRYSDLLQEIAEAEENRNKAVADYENAEKHKGELTSKSSLASQKYYNEDQEKGNQLRELQNVIDSPQILITATTEKSFDHEAFNAKMIVDGFDSAKERLANAKTKIFASERALRIGYNRPGTGAFRYYQGAGGDKSDTIVTAQHILNYFTEGIFLKDYQLFMGNAEQLIKIETFVRYFERFSRMINKFSKGLNAHMNQATHFGAINNLEVKVTFTYADSDNWRIVKSIDEEYTVWKQDVGGISTNLNAVDKLPHQKLIDAIERFLDLSSTTDLSINDVHEHIDFEFTIDDQGVTKRANSLKKINSEKTQVSSNGISNLIVLSIFIGILNMRRADNVIHFNWSLDELADIDPENILTLFRLLKDNHIHLLSACTVTDDAVYTGFDNTYTFGLEKGNKVLINEKDIDPLSELEKNYG